MVTKLLITFALNSATNSPPSNDKSPPPSNRHYIKPSQGFTLPPVALLTYKEGLVIKTKFLVVKKDHMPCTETTFIFTEQRTLGTIHVMVLFVLEMR